MPNGVRTEALARTEEMESLIAFTMEDIEREMAGKGLMDFFNVQPSKASY